MRIIFSGTIGRSGLGGQVWATLQYLLGLRALGHDVVYLEDCGDCSYVYDWEKQEWTYDLDCPSEYLQRCLAPHALEGAWIYRTDSDSRGINIDEFKEFCRTADLLVMRAVPLWTWRPEYDLPQRRVFLDVDPGFTQISIANGDEGIAKGIARAERRFTVAQNIGRPGCLIPEVGGPWLKTLPPVFLPAWPFVEGEATHFTSVIRWRGFREASFDGVTYGQRDKEFPQFIDLPRRTTQLFRLAQMGAEPGMFKTHGWEVVPGEVISRTPDSYREFIQQSRAEFSVPKNAYVRTRGGWFSDRSVCYLASGRPVLIEDTGLRDWLATGAGVVTFDSVDGALAGVDRINTGYEQHRRAARQLAETVFSTERVLPAFLDAAMS